MTETTAAGGTPSVRPVPPAAKPGAEPTEAQMARAIIAAARFTGWRVAHFRPARTIHGWRTPVQGDGAGFPDLVLLHPDAGLTWWCELKAHRGHLSPEQREWARDLGQCGQRFIVCRGRDGLTKLLDDMAVIPRTGGTP